MAKAVLMFFKKECMGCHACEIACKQEHALGIGPRLVRVIENSPDYHPVYCHHCSNTPCLQSCRVDAIERTAQGIVLIDNDQCIGCKECLEACPFGAMQFDAEKEIAVKCDLCIDRLEKNEPPACTSVCATQSIFFGDTRQFADKIATSR